MAQRCRIYRALWPHVDTELEGAGLVKDRWPYPSAARVVNIDGYAFGVGEPHDLPQLVLRHNLVGDREAGHDHQRHTCLSLQCVAEVRQARCIDQRGASVRYGPHDRGVTVAGRHPNDDVPGLDERQVRGIRGASQSVEERYVVPLGRAAEVLQRRLLKLIKVESRPMKSLAMGSSSSLSGSPCSSPEKLNIASGPCPCRRAAMYRHACWSLRKSSSVLVRMRPRAYGSPGA